MIAETGHFALVLALMAALVQATLPLIGAWRNIDSWIAVARPAAVVQFLLIALSFGALMSAFVTSDFSLAVVAANSNSAKPMVFKITGLWGNHEGSLLLWILILAGFGAAVALFGRNLPPKLQARVLSVQALVGVGFLLFILITSNPFLRLDPAPIDGRGLNPLLQDIGLAFHPPPLYLGYVGLSVAFSFSLAALIEGRVDPAWARWVRPWTLVAWCFLTLGITMGSWWAYYELGWGGWWFWDPVENASFMPWLVATALVHSVIVVEKRDTLKSWTILLAILAFSLSVLGMFLVRSGVLNSVHAFATDPTRGLFVLGFLVFVVGGSLTLFAMRGSALKTGSSFAPVSREGALVLNNLLLTTAAGSILLGTLYPLFLDALTGSKVSVGGPYFNSVFIPLITPLLAAMAVGPLLPWKKADLAGIFGRLKVAVAATVIVVLGTWYMLDNGPVLALLGMALAAWTIGGALVEWAGRIKLFRAPLGDSWRRAKGLPRAAYGMTVAHIGVGLLIAGITVSETWSEEKLLVMQPGETAQVGGYDFEFDGTEMVAGPNYESLRGKFTVTRDGKLERVMLPEARTYQTPPLKTTEAAIRPSMTADLYVVIGEAANSGGYAVRIYYKPMVSWIWFGTFVMILGGVISLTDRRQRARVSARRRKPAVAATPAPAGD